MMTDLRMPEADADTRFTPHTSHWGVFSARMKDGELEVRQHPGDPDPNEIIQNFPAALRHRARIAQPMVRRGWLENGPGPDDRRGRDQYVPLSWDEAFDLLGGELKRIRDDHGPAAVFGGSYGWASAGRFHHAQSQIHRFLNTAMGGYLRSINTYSSGASQPLTPHIIGDYEDLTKRNVSWEQIAEHSEIVIAFGRDGAEERDGRRRQHQQACRARLHGARRRARLRVPAGRPPALRPPGRGQGRMDLGQSC